MPDNGTNLVRKLQKQVADEQGGTEFYDSNNEVNTKAPSSLGAHDASRPDPEEGYGSGMGVAANGEWMTRNDATDDDDAEDGSSIIES